MHPTKMIDQVGQAMFPNQMMITQGGYTMFPNRMVNQNILPNQAYNVSKM